jgi:hypothetical protein
MIEPIVLPRWRGDRPLNDRIGNARVALLATPGLPSGIFDPGAIRAWLAMLPDYDSSRSYGQLKPALRAIESELTARHGELAAHRIGLAMLLELVASHEQRWVADGLDCELKPDFVDSMHRVLDAVERGGSGSTRMSHDNYCKELAICLHRLIPAGGQLVDPGSGVPRSLLLHREVSAIPGQLGYLLGVCQGFKPFAEFHTHERMRHLFTPDGWEYCFRRLPALFRSRPALKGVVAGSWFFDPQLAVVSPNLSFVRELPLRWGAIFLRGGVDPGATGGALAMSQHRRDLHAAGCYQPTIYFMVAAKSRILRHARAVGLA